MASTKRACNLDRLRGLVADADVVAYGVIRRFLQAVGAREKADEPPLDARVVLGEAGELAANATVGLGGLAGAVEDQSLRGMKSGKIGCASGCFGQAAGENNARLS